MWQAIQRVITLTNILVVVYILIVWVSADSNFQFETVALLESDFPGEETQWHVKGEVGNTLITSSQVAIVPLRGSRTRLTKSYELKDARADKRYISIKGSIVSKRVAQPVPLENANMTLERSLFFANFKDMSDQSIPISVLAELENTDQRLKTSNILLVPISASQLSIELLLREFQAQHALVALEIEQVKRTSAYKMSVIILLIGAIAGTFIAFARIRAHISFIPVAVVSAVALALVVGVLVPGKALTASLMLIGKLAAPFNNLIQQYNVSSIQDVLHFLGFLVLTLVVLTLCKKMEYNAVNGLFKIMLFAVFTELAQRHSIERSPSMVDIVTDLSGTAVGALIFWLLSKIRVPKPKRVS